MASPEKRKRSKSKDRKAEKGSERKKRGEKRKKQHSPGNDVVGKSGDEGGSRSGGKKARDKRGRGESQGRADAEGDPSPPPAGAAQATISVGSADPSHDPVIVSFPGGVPNRMLETEEREADRQTKRRVRFDGGDENEDGGGGASGVPSFTWSRQKMSSLKGKAVRGEDRTCSYEASCAGRGTDGRRSKMLVGVYDSKLGTLTLHPAAENGTVFALSQTVKSYKGTGSSEIKATEAGMSYADKRRALFDSFGTVRKQRSLKSHEASIVSVDNVVGSGRGMMGAVERQEQSRSNREAMDRAVERARDGGDDGDHSKVGAIEAALAEARKNFLPPFNADATAPHKVYDPKTIAGEALWDRISRDVTACTAENADDWRELILIKGTSNGKKWPQPLRELLDSTHLDQKGAKTQLKTLMLLKHLFNFHSIVRGKEGLRGAPEELAKDFDVPEELMSMAVESFTAPVTDSQVEKFSMTKQLIDKRLIHILLLYMMASGSEMKVASINKMCSILPLDCSEASKLLREAGCVVKKSSATGMLSVSLSVPLTFPRYRKMNRS